MSESRWQDKINKDKFFNEQIGYTDIKKGDTVIVRLSGKKGKVTDFGYNSAVKIKFEDGSEGCIQKEALFKLDGSKLLKQNAEHEQYSDKKLKNFDKKDDASMNHKEITAASIMDLVKTADIDENEERRLLVSDAAGIYVPKEFISRYDAKAWGVSDEQESILSNPENEFYWEVWDEVLNNAKLEYEGKVWRLYQDGDLWAVADKGPSSLEGEAYEEASMIKEEPKFDTFASFKKKTKKAAPADVSNWDTKELIMWVENDESLYNEVKSIIRRNYSVTNVAKAANDLFHQINFDKVNLDAVDWDSAADYLIESLFEGDNDILSLYDKGPESHTFASFKGLEDMVKVAGGGAGVEFNFSSGCSGDDHCIFSASTPEEADNFKTWEVHGFVMSSYEDSKTMDAVFTVSIEPVEPLNAEEFQNGCDICLDDPKCMYGRGWVRAGAPDSVTMNGWISSREVARSILITVTFPDEVKAVYDSLDEIVE